MKRILAAPSTATFAVSLLLLSLAMLSTFSACNGSASRKGKDTAPQFAVDTTQMKRYDSTMVSIRRRDSILLQQAGNTPGINAGNGKFTIKTPPGWKRVDTLLGTIRAVIMDTSSIHPTFRTNINIVSDSLRGLSEDKYLDATLRNMTVYVPQFKLVGKGERQIAGRSARWIHYSQSRGGTDIENICYIIADKGVAYIVTCSALKGQLIKNYQAFERTVRSFTIH